MPVSLLSRLVLDLPKTNCITINFHDKLFRYNTFTLLALV